MEVTRCAPLARATVAAPPRPPDRPAPRRLRAGPVLLALAIVSAGACRDATGPLAPVPHPEQDAASYSTSPPGSLAATLSGCNGAAPLRTIQATPSNYRSLIAGLIPGDRLLLAAGTYTQGLPLHNKHGQPGKCIVVEGPASGSPALFTGSDSWNVVSLKDASYIAVRNLSLDGLGKAGDGVKAEATAVSVHHVLIEGLSLRNFNQNYLTRGHQHQGPGVELGRALQHDHQHGHGDVLRQLQRRGRDGQLPGGAQPRPQHAGLQRPVQAPARPQHLHRHAVVGDDHHPPQHLQQGGLPRGRSPERARTCSWAIGRSRARAPRTCTRSTATSSTRTPTRGCSRVKATSPSTTTCW